MSIHAVGVEQSWKGSGVVVLLSALLIAAALTLASARPACAEPPGIAAFAGTWAADVSRLPMPVEARPQRVTIRFAEAEGGRLATRVEVVDPAGAVLFAESVAALDGIPVPVAGNLEADTATAAMPAPGVLIMQLARAGVPGSTRVYTLAADQQTMTETAANYADDGSPFMRTHHFHRVQSGSGSVP